MCVRERIGEIWKAKGKDLFHFSHIDFSKFQEFLLIQCLFCETLN